MRKHILFTKNRNDVSLNFLIKKKNFIDPSSTEEKCMYIILLDPQKRQIVINWDVKRLRRSLYQLTLYIEIKG